MLAVTSASLLVGALAPLAHADEASDDDGLWYFARTGVAQAQTRTTGIGVHIAVIDTAVNPDVPELRGTALRVHEPSFCATEPLGEALPAASHGPDAARGTTTVALIIGTGTGTGGEPGIRGVAPGAQVSFYSNATTRAANPGDTPRCFATDVADPDAQLRLGPAIDQAVADGADILAVALSTPSLESSAAIARALRAGVLIVAAQGPSSTGGYPADLDGVVSVDTVGPDDSWWVDRRVGATVLAPGGLVRTYAPGFAFYERSTFAANAVGYTAGVLALAWSAYPGATANQLVQSLVRNTGPEDHELRDPGTEVGYGVVDVLHLLEHDPTEYPDLNPLLTTSPDRGPALDPTAGASTTATASPAAAAGGSAGGSAGASADGTSSPLLVAGLALLAAVGVGVAFRRSPHTRASVGPTTAAPDRAAPLDPRPHPGGT